MQCSANTSNTSKSRGAFGLSIEEKNIMSESSHLKDLYDEIYEENTDAKFAHERARSPTAERFGSSSLKEV